jgi:hypothetical protein
MIRSKGRSASRRDDCLRRQGDAASPAIETKEYDLVTPMFSADGKFPASGLEVLARSFVELGQLDSEPA